MDKAKTVFNLDETSVKQAVSDNLERLLEAVEYSMMDVMQAHNAEFCTDEHSEQPNPYYPDTALNVRVYLEVCIQLAMILIGTLPEIVKQHKAPFILPVDAIRNAYLSDRSNTDE